jgi:adhesin HecA-like repeat protein
MSASALIVDDHPLYRDALVQLLRGMLGDGGVQAASSAEEGLRIAERLTDLRLVLLDFALPGLSGTEALAAIQRAEHGATIAAAALSNLTSSARILTATDGGAAGDINVTGLLSNAGAIHGGGDLSVHAGSIANATSAGLSSLGTLALGTTGDITNSGSIYAGTQLAVTSGGTFSNVGAAAGLAGTTAAGVPGSGVGGMTFNVDTFSNTGTVLAEGGIQITARDFRNDPIGGLPTLVSETRAARSPARLSKTRRSKARSSRVAGTRQQRQQGRAACSGQGRRQRGRRRRVLLVGRDVYDDEEADDRQSQGRCGGGVERRHAAQWNRGEGRRDNEGRWGGAETVCEADPGQLAVTSAWARRWLGVG